MKNLIWIIVIFLCLSLSKQAICREIDSENLVKLMEYSGISQMANDLAALIGEGLEDAQVTGENRDFDFTKAQQSLTSAFPPQYILQTLTKTLQENISAHDSKTLLKWYESEIGKKISLAEKLSTSNNALMDMLKSSESLRSNQEKVSLVLQLDELIKATDITIGVHENIGIAVTTALNKSPMPPMISTTNLSETGNDDVEAREAIHEMVVTSLLYSYKDISIEDLQRYVTFSEDPLTRKFNQSILLGLSKVFKDSPIAIMPSTNKIHLGVQ